MGVRLVLVDHHLGQLNFNNYQNITVIKADSLELFYEIVGRYLDEKYDLILTDEDPDGITSTLQYMLVKNKDIKFYGNRSGISSTTLQDFEREGINNILAFDWFPINFSEVQAFEEIIVLNPVLSGLPNVNTSEIVYRSLGKTSKFIRDLSAIGTICDYLVDSAKEKFDDFMEDYKELFPVLYELSKKDKLDRYNILRLNKTYTKLFDISLMFWAPFIIEGQEGNNKLVKLILTNLEFTINDLIEGSDNGAVLYLRECYQKLMLLIEEEKYDFVKEVKVIGNIYVYSPKIHRTGFQSKFSSIISDEISEENPNAVIIMKGVGQETVNYSFRTRSTINLAELLKRVNMGGGGHPNAAGAIIKINEEKEFERKFIELLNVT